MYVYSRAKFDNLTVLITQIFTRTIQRNNYILELYDNNFESQL